MRVILKEDVENLGFKGDQVNVKPGFARNYLIPRNLAIPLTPSALKELEETRRQKARKEERLLQKAKSTLGTLLKQRLRIEVKSSQEGKLFGAVTAKQIAEAITARGFEIDRKFVLLKEPIRKVGVFPVVVRFHRDLIRTIEVEVALAAEEGEPGAAGDTPA